MMELGCKMSIRDQHLWKEREEQDWAEIEVGLWCRLPEAPTTQQGALGWLLPIVSGSQLSPSVPRCGCTERAMASGRAVFNSRSRCLRNWWHSLQLARSLPSKGDLSESTSHWVLGRVVVIVSYWDLYQHCCNGSRYFCAYWPFGCPLLCKCLCKSFAHL